MKLIFVFILSMTLLACTSDKLGIDASTVDYSYGEIPDLFPKNILLGRAVSHHQFDEKALGKSVLYVRRAPLSDETIKATVYIYPELLSEGKTQAAELQAALHEITKLSLDADVASESSSKKILSDTVFLYGQVLIDGRHEHVYMTNYRDEIVKIRVSSAGSSSAMQSADVFVSTVAKHLERRASSAVTAMNTNH